MNPTRSISSMTKVTAKAMQEFMHMLNILKQDYNNPFFETALDRITKAAQTLEATEGMKSIPLLTVDSHYFPHLLKAMNENHVDYVPFDIKDGSTGLSDKKMILYNPEQIELVKLCREKAIMERGKIHNIPYNSFAKFNYNEKIVKIPNKDELWVNRFHFYAKELNLNYTLEENEPGKYTVIAAEKEKETLYKATFSTNWDFTGKFKNIERRRAEEALERDDRYTQRISDVAEKGDIYLVNISNSNERIRISMEGYELYYKDNLVRSQGVKEYDYDINLTRMLDNMGDQKLLVEGSAYRDATDKEALFKDVFKEEKRLFINKDVLKEIQNEKELQYNILKNGPFENTLQFDAAQVDRVKSMLMNEYLDSQRTLGTMQTRAEGINESLPDSIKPTYAHFAEAVALCNIDNKNLQIGKVDLTMLDIESIKEAKEYEMEKVVSQLEKDASEREEREEGKEIVAERDLGEEPEQESPLSYNLDDIEEIDL